jgi:hypothetical protein
VEGTDGGAELEANIKINIKKNITIIEVFK